MVEMNMQMIVSINHWSSYRAVACLRERYMTTTLQWCNSTSNPVLSWSVHAAAWQQGRHAVAWYFHVARVTLSEPFLGRKVKSQGHIGLVKHRTETKRTIAVKGMGTISPRRYYEMSRRYDILDCWRLKIEDKCHESNIPSAWHGNASRLYETATLNPGLGNFPVRAASIKG